jgi:hypothetical protein
MRFVTGYPPRWPGSDLRLRHAGFVVDKAVFAEYFGFSCQSFHRLLHTHHYPSSGAGTIGPIAADVANGFCLTSPQETKKKTEVDYPNWFSPNCITLQQRILHSSAVRTFSRKAKFQWSARLRESYGCRTHIETDITGAAMLRQLMLTFPWIHVA